MAKAVQLKDKNGNKVFAAPWMPIGSIFLTVSNDNPSKYFGGKWEKISGGFLWGCNSGVDNNLMNSKVGHTKSFDTTLTIDQIPSHNHLLKMKNAGKWNWTSGTAKGEMMEGGYSWNENDTTYNWLIENSPVGGNKGHSHKIPYIGVWVWKRIK